MRTLRFTDYRWRRLTSRSSGQHLRLTQSCRLLFGLSRIGSREGSGGLSWSVLGLGRNRHAFARLGVAAQLQRSASNALNMTKRLIGLLIILSFLGCDYFTIATGRVTDETGSPIEGAQVTLQPSATRPGVTDSAGRFDIAVASGGPREYALTVRKQGYVTYTEKLSKTQKKVERRIVLKRRV